MSTIKAVFILAFLMPTASAVTIYTAGAKDNKQCEFALQPLQEILASAPAYPRDWRIIVACTDTKWQDILTHYDAVGISNYAITIRQLHVTVIRGRIFQDLCISSRQRFVVLHELGHVILKTDSEDNADKYANDHMRVRRIDRGAMGIQNNEVNSVRVSGPSTQQAESDGSGR